MFSKDLFVRFIVLFYLYHKYVNNTKEVNIMKTTVYRTNFANRPHAPYPNAATYREVLHKALDLLLVAAIGTGAAAAFLFLAVLF